MKKILLIIILLLLVLYYIDTQTHCITNRIYKLENVSKKQTIMLYKIKTQEHVHHYFVHIIGHLDGSTKIKLYQSLKNKNPYKSAKITGDIDIKWGGDWYVDTLRIEYEPIDVKEGQLSLEYAFYGI